MCCSNARGDLAVTRPYIHIYIYILELTCAFNAQSFVEVAMWTRFKKNVWLKSAKHQPPAALERRTSPLALPLSRALALSLSRSPALSLSHSIALSLSLASIGCVFPACFDRSLARNEAKNRSGDAFSSVAAALERS